MFDMKCPVPNETWNIDPIHIAELHIYRKKVIFLLFQLPFSFNLSLCYGI